MRNYVIINGVNSLTIQGLAIKTLPPITKPIQRNLREEIDGRDGDIVTTLGYGAYDKTIEIGLFGTFDIDEVIAYFNQKGTITFSNEADKVYYFEALDQVDYAELLKFRTASINFHCQPFKYPLNETPLEEEYEYVEGEGTELTLNDTANAIFNKFDLKGNTSQASTPTPSSPIPVNVVSGNNTIEICGKNIANSNLEKGSIDGTTGQDISSNNQIRTNYIELIGSGTWVFKRINDTTNIKCRYYDKDFNYLGYTPQVGTDLTKVITPPANAKYVRFTLDLSNLNYFNDYKVQLEKGNQATTYEPYIGNTYPIYLGDIELCKIGTYQDYIYKDNGSWYLHKEIGKVVLDGSENWNNDGGTQGTDYRHNIYYASRMSIPVAKGTNGTYLSNYFATRNVSSDVGELGTFYMSNTWLVFPDKNKTYDLADFKTWLSNNKPSVYYVLATPTNTLIEDTTLIEQLESLSIANSYKGQTNISQTNNDAPFILSVSTLKDGSDHLVINNIGNIYAKPTLDLEGNGIVDIYLNDTQMFEVDLSETNEIVINTQDMEAYNPTDNTLANRQVTGDYSKFKLDSGENDLRFSGALTKATITRYVRWL